MQIAGRLSAALVLKRKEEEPFILSRRDLAASRRIFSLKDNKTKSKRKGIWIKFIWARRIIPNYGTKMN